MNGATDTIRALGYRHLMTYTYSPPPRVLPISVQGQARDRLTPSASRPGRGMQYSQILCWPFMGNLTSSCSGSLQISTYGLSLSPSGNCSLRTGSETGQRRRTVGAGSETGQPRRTVGRFTYQAAVTPTCHKLRASVI